jgi:tetratricopeptide (TPR) repeat protein
MNPRTMRAARIVALCAALFSGLSVAAGADGSKEAELAHESGQLKLRAGDLEGARADFEKAASKSPDDEKYLNALGLIYLRTSRGELAAQTYGRSCAITEARYGSKSARLFGCHSLWGNALLLIRDFRGAEEKFRLSYAIAFAQDPRSVEDCLIALYYLAQALSGSDRLVEASSLYEQLLNSTSPINRRFPEIEDALRRVRAGQTPLRMLR